MKTNWPGTHFTHTNLMKPLNLHFTLLKMGMISFSFKLHHHGVNALQTSNGVCSRPGMKRIYIFL